MIIYRCMNGKLNDKNIDDVTINKAHGILKESDIIIKSLPGYGNLRKRKKDIKPFIEPKCNVKITS